ncbi:MAG: hypothetical protein JXJ04_01525 [Spirochaetales bacterium]|nr:hypothetical protein [Spirochaetales bacterium]
MKKKPGIIILFFALALIIGFIGFTMFEVYLTVNKEISLAKKAPELDTPAMIEENEKKVCWIKGVLKVDDPNKLVLSPGGEIPCVYYIFNVEYATYDTDSDGDTRKTWHTSEKKEDFAGIPLIVKDEEYTIPKKEEWVRGELKESLSGNKTQHGTEYRYSEYIIPDKSSVWVLGIPYNKRIEKTEIGFIITMNTPDKFIEEDTTTSIALIIIACVFMCLALFFAGLSLWIIMKK